MKRRTVVFCTGMLLASLCFCACGEKSKEAETAKIPTEAAGKVTPPPTDAPVPTKAEQLLEPTKLPIPTPPLPGSDLYLDPKDEAALKSPLQQKLEMKVRMEEDAENSLLKIEIAGDAPWYKNMSLHVTDGSVHNKILSYLVDELGAQRTSSYKTYSLSLCSDAVYFERDKETKALLAHCSYEKRSGEFPFRAEWTCEYFDFYGWKVVEFHSVRLETVGDQLVEVPFMDGSLARENRMNYYIGPLRRAPIAPSELFYERDIDGDGIPDDVYVNAPAKGQQERTCTLQFSSGGTLDLGPTGWLGYYALRLYDVTGDGAAEILFFINEGKHYQDAPWITKCDIYMQTEDGTWELLPSPFEALPVTITPVGEGKYTETVSLANGEKRVFGPFYYGSDLGDTAYSYGMWPWEIVGFFTQCVPGKPEQTVLRMQSDGYFYYTESSYIEETEPMHPLTWEIYYEDGAWKVLSVEAQAKQTYYPLTERTEYVYTDDRGWVEIRYVYKDGKWVVEEKE